MPSSRITLGAPGLTFLPEEPVRALTGARMDVCAFVGVAPRGPSRPPVFDAPWAQRPCDAGRTTFPRSIAVPVESFDAYRRLYGGFEGPGLLPYAVASFFEQGGRRAYVVRIVHAYRTAGGDPDPVADAGRVARATLALADGSPLKTAGGVAVALRARDEGAWGNGLRAALSFRATPLSFAFVATTEIAVAPDQPLPLGGLVRFRFTGADPVLRVVTALRREWDPARPAVRNLATLSEPLPAPPDTAEVVTGALDVDDGDGRQEHHDDLGLSPLHPRWLARAVYEDSVLVHPAAEWADADLVIPGGAAAPLIAGPFTGGADDYPAIVPDDFFDDEWVLGDDCPGAGVHALVALPDLAQVVAADLYSPAPLAPTDRPPAPLPGAGPEFATCLPAAAPVSLVTATGDLDGLRLDPKNPIDLAIITDLQARLCDLADALQSFIVLLDVPPGLGQQQILRWRQRFGTAYAAAYHPWLRVARPDDQRDALIAVNPAAVAAGIIAAREWALGIPHGPANVVAAGVVDVADRVSPARHDELHQNAVNVYRMARDGVELTAARTLSLDPAYRQLSVRRLVTMLRRVLEAEMQWAVFEPNSAALREDVRQLLINYLRQLYRANAFRGATENEAFFVKCDAELNPPDAVDAGELVAHVGVAPAEPLEFILLRIARDGDGTLRVEG
jgi:hypothetical protein